jgi:hypothetical protein
MVPPCWLKPQAKHHYFSIVFSIDQKIVRREDASTRAPNIKVRMLLHFDPASLAEATQVLSPGEVGNQRIVRGIGLVRLECR